MVATVIYDFETSGLSPHNDDIIEIGAKCVENDIIFETLVIPLSKKGVSYKITEITGITNDLLSKGTRTLDAFIKFFTYLNEIYTSYGGLTMVAHNGLHFDDIFLRRMHRYLQGEGHTQFDSMLDNIIFIDSLMVCRYIHPERYTHSMKAMCQLYNIKNVSAHRAMGDVHALSELWKYLTDHLKQHHSEVGGSHLKYILYY